MKKVFLVFAVSFTMFSVCNASNSLVTETTICQFGENQIIHDNPKYMEIFVYADNEYRVLIEIKTINKENADITTEVFNTNTNTNTNSEICLID